jgi:cell division transport system permease protein
MGRSSLVFLATEAARNFRRTGWVGVSAVVLIALSMMALGVFGLLSMNMGRAITQWRERVKIVVYLREEPPPSAAERLMERFRQIEGVGRVRYVSKYEALSRLRAQLGDQSDLVDRLPTNPLPASVEVGPTSEMTTPEGNRVLVEKLAALPEVEEVQGSSEWVDRLAQFRRLLMGIGFGVGTLLVLAATLTVTVSTILVIHSRRQELEIMRLVGAPESAVWAPLVLQGLLQGLVGAFSAVALLAIGYRLLSPRLIPFFTETLGFPQVSFFSWLELLVLIGSGGLLGAVGGFLARGRVSAA